MQLKIRFLDLRAKGVNACSGNRTFLYCSHISLTRKFLQINLRIIKRYVSRRAFNNFFIIHFCRNFSGVWLLFGLSVSLSLFWKLNMQKRTKWSGEILSTSLPTHVDSVSTTQEQVLFTLTISRSVCSSLTTVLSVFRFSFFGISATHLKYCISKKQTTFILWTEEKFLTKQNSFQMSYPFIGKPYL